MQFQKKSPPHGRSSEIPRGRGCLKFNILEAKYEAKLEFPGEEQRGGGGGAKQETCGGYGYFLLHNLHCVRSCKVTGFTRIF